jgi:BirA family biotin operon repressor/biotin-[acetyl-CoA-carboxylase] ligase
VDTRKVCGILIQNSLHRHLLASSIVGIGVNVNQVIFSKDIPNPSSLQLESGKAYDLNALIPQLCQHLEATYLRLRAGQQAQLSQEYLQFLYRYQQRTLFQGIQERMFWGKISGISPLGHLLIAVEGGEEEEFDLKEVKILGG